MKVSYATIAANKQLFILKMLDKHGAMKTWDIMNIAKHELECYLSPGTIYYATKQMIVNGDLARIKGKGIINITEQGKKYLQLYTQDLKLFTQWLNSTIHKHSNNPQQKFQP